MNMPNTITGHLHDLLNRDISVAYDCTLWLQPKQRDIDRRVRSKRISKRYIAACMIVQAAENPAFVREVLDRTEGKLANVVISGNFEDLVKALENGRQRLLAPIAEPQAAIEGEVVNLPVVVNPEVSIPEDQLPVTDSTESTPSK